MQDTTMSGHVENLTDVGKDLESRIEHMATILRLYEGTPQDGDAERLEIVDTAQDPATLSEDGMRDVAYELADGYALEARVARWTGDGGEPADLARVNLLLTCGGPTISLEVDYLGDVLPERVTLRRSWGSERDYAVTTDGRALETVDSFLRAFYVVED